MPVSFQRTDSASKQAVRVQFIDFQTLTEPCRPSDGAVSFTVAWSDMGASTSIRVLTVGGS